MLKIFPNFAYIYKENNKIMIDYNTLLDLSLHEEIDSKTYTLFTRLYRLSLMFSKNGTGSFYYSQQRLADELKITLPTLRKAIKKLIELRFIGMEYGDRGKNEFNTYHICTEEINIWYNGWLKKKEREAKKLVRNVA